MSDGTRPTPAVGGPPPEPPGGPSWQTIVIATLLALIVLLGLILVLVRSGGDDGDDVATDDSVTTTSATSTTTSSTSTTPTTVPPTTTTTPAQSTSVPAPTSTTRRSTTTSSTPPATVVPVRCTGLSGPADPDPVAEVFYEAWTLDDRRCAEQVATDEAVDQLFFFDGTDAGWTFEGCVDDEDGDWSNCSFRYEGGSATFQLRFDDVTGWEVFAVAFRAD